MSEGKNIAGSGYRRPKIFTESKVLALLLGILALAFGFFQIADEVADNETFHIDDVILRFFRNPDDLHLTRGPEWLKSFFLDVTALGGTTNLIIITLVTLGFLWIINRKRLFLLVLVSVCGGQAFNSLLKHFFMRPRPSVVPHLTEVQTPSFPSGHSMMSAVVYLTLGVLLSRLVSKPVQRFYIVSVAIVITVLVGVSRVVLGVHYPTDVLGGWTVGLAWALLCLLVAQILQRKGKVEEPVDDIEGEESA